MTVGWTNQPTSSEHWPPSRSFASADLDAAAIAAFCFVNEALSITAPMKFVKSETSPVFTSASMAARRSFTSFQRLFGTYARLAAEHFWPWYSNAPRTSATHRACASADG